MSWVLICYTYIIILIPYVICRDHSSHQEIIKIKAEKREKKHPKVRDKATTYKDYEWTSLY